MDIHEAVATASAVGEAELHRAYRAAVAHEATSTQCAADEERTYDTLRLLTLATLRLPDLFLSYMPTSCTCSIRTATTIMSQRRLTR